MSEATVNAVVKVGRLTYRWIFLEGEQTAIKANVQVLVGFWCRITGQFIQLWMKAFTEQPLPPKGLMSHYRELLYDALRVSVVKLMGRDNLFILNIKSC